MKLLILGATGQTGRELVAQGLGRGYEVTALVRQRRKIPIEDDRLEVVEGSPLDARMIDGILPGQDAVLSVLGHTDLKESYLVTEAAETLVRGMRDQGNKRLLIVSSTLVAPGGSFLTTIPRLITRHALNDSARMEDLVRSTHLDWTIVRLVRLTNKAASAYRIFEDEPPSVSASISRRTVAACLLDLARDAAYFKKTIGVRGAHPREVEARRAGVTPPGDP
jgi:putative NADH-flavin reductase